MDPNPYSDATEIIGRLLASVRDASSELTESNNSGSALFAHLQRRVTREMARAGAKERLRRFGTYLVSLGDRHHFRGDPLLLAWICKPEQQLRLQALQASGAYPASRITRADLGKIFDDGGDTWRICKRSHAAAYGTGLLPLSDVRQALNRSEGLLWPAARYDELLMTLLTGTWLALFFLGERWDVLWSIVIRLARSQSGSLPDGCCITKAIGDVFRDTQERLDRSLPEARSVFSRLRAKATSLDAFCPFKADEIGHELAPVEFGGLGRFYVFWMIVRYVRVEEPVSPRPITIVVRMDGALKPFGFDRSSQHFIVKDEWKPALRMVFGKRYNRSWDEKERFPQHGDPVLAESYKASLFAVPTGMFDSDGVEAGYLGLSRGVVGELARDPSNARVGRFVAADLTRTHQYLYRHLANAAADNYDGISDEVGTQDVSVSARRRLDWPDRMAALLRQLADTDEVIPVDSNRAINLLEILEFSDALPPRPAINHNGRQGGPSRGIPGGSI